MEAMPYPVVRQRGFHVYFLLGHRMHEAYAPGMKANPPVGIAAWRAILQVALDGTAYFGQLATDLMVAPRLQVHFQQEVALRRADETVGKHRLLRAGQRCRV